MRSPCCPTRRTRILRNRHYVVSAWEKYRVLFDGPEIGLYRLENGEHTAVIGLGPASPVEFEETIASAEPLSAVIDGLPRIREVREGRPAAGRGWIGITPRGAYETRAVTQLPLLPAWLVLALAAALIVAGWLREGRR